MASIILNSLLYLYFGIVVMAAIMSTWFRSSLQHPLNYIFIYLWLDVLVEIVVYLMNLNNMYSPEPYNWFGPIEFFFVTWLYFSFFRTSVEKNVLKSLFIGYSLFCLVHISTLNHLNDYNLVFLIRSLLTTGITLFYFLKLYQNNQLIEMTKRPLFWISTGWLIFFMGSVFSMGLGQLIKQMDKELGYSVYVLNALLNVYLFSMFIVSLLCSRRNPGFY